MTHFFYGLVLLLLVNHSTFGQRKTSLAELKSSITTELDKHKGTYAVAFKDLTSGEELLILEHEVFHAASTMKMPVMVEVFKQAGEGKFSLTDSITIKNEFKSIVDGSVYSQDSINDSEHELYKRIGEKAAIKDLVYDMIIVSSNFATNMIVDLVDPKKVTQTMRQLGAKDLLILRGVEDSKAFAQGLNNTTTAYDLMLIFEKMAEGKIINQEACDAMIKILLDQKFRSLIPAKLPKDVKVAHKTGYFGTTQHDSGIVFLPDGRKYVVVILSREWDDRPATLDMLSGISRMIYDYVK
ncbi:hypothetical protein DYBT9275_05564 [Dyadobacter sp. CECT 9275]|uniref:beta-lactamase n=1 Tax=Dyadobacter helix TaxID=2822344 RepID=A0A916JIL2_9BACT|nr:serine hydrolase [Dyadobacter sp. CECT 9275]CAG5016481.1 hypothetical protein DYBT9275_05564 [Dyadobacter sp. CECT 9275]